MLVAALAPAPAQATGAEFQERMSQALDALAAERWPDASARLEQAAQLKPEDPQARQLLRYARERQRARQILALLSQARAAEETQDWRAALRLYREAQALDAYVAEAATGARRSAPYVAAQEALAELLAEPKKLFDPVNRRRARQLLDAMERDRLEGRELAAGREALQERLAQAETPQLVYLSSDGQSEVSIYKGETLGRFQEKQLRLKPGKYVAVARRDRYRDVRRDFWVLPERPTRFDIRCKDPI